MSASYTLVKTSSGVYVANTSVSWKRKYGRCDMRTHNRFGTVYTQTQLKAWAKRNKVIVAADDLSKMPKTIWG